jgi:transposase-like protein
MPSTLSPSPPSLLRLTKRDPNPRVRCRAHALLLAAEGAPLPRVARLFQTAPHRIRVWRTQLLARGRAGLTDAPMPPPRTSSQAERGELGTVGEALTNSP